MTDPADKSLHRVMSEDWARHVPPKRGRTDRTAVAMMIFGAALVLAVIGAAAFGRGMVDAEASIEIGREGRR